MTDCPARILATPAADALIARLTDQHGPLMFHQSGGCCDGSAPMCYPAGEFRVGGQDILLGTVDGHRGAFEGKALGVAVEFLQQTTTGAKAEIVGRPTVTGCGLENEAKHGEIYTVALDDPNLGVEQAKALGVAGGAEFFA